MTPLRDPDSSRAPFESFGWQLSLAFHGAVVLLIILSQWVLPGEALPILPTLRVDLVGLPDQTKSEQILPGKAEELRQAEDQAKRVQTPDLSSIPIPKSKPEDQDTGPALQVRSDAKKESPKKDRRNQLLASLNRIKSLQKIQADDRPGTPVAGNRVSRGTSLSADALQAMQSTYFDLVRDRLQEHWSLPIWLSRQNFSAQIQLTIDGSGRVKFLRWLKRSGNDSFDQFVQRAVQDAQPFDRPPSEVVSLVESRGIQVGFPL